MVSDAAECCIADQMAVTPLCSYYNIQRALEDMKWRESSEDEDEATISEDIASLLQAERNYRSRWSL